MAEQGRDLLRALQRQSNPPRDLHTVSDLIDAIETYLTAHNENAKPFQWTATSDQILAKVGRERVTLDATAS